MWTGRELSLRVILTGNYLYFSISLRPWYELVVIANTCNTSGKTRIVIFTNYLYELSLHKLTLLMIDSTKILYTLDVVSLGENYRRTSSPANVATSYQRSTDDSDSHEWIHMEFTCELCELNVRCSSRKGRRQLRWASDPVVDWGKSIDCISIDEKAGRK